MGWEGDWVGAQAGRGSAHGQLTVSKGGAGAQEGPGDTSEDRPLVGHRHLPAGHQQPGSLRPIWPGMQVAASIQNGPESPQNLGYCRPR